MKILDVLKKEFIFPELISETKPAVIEELSQKVSELTPSLNFEKVYETLMEREKLCSTAVDSGVAIPHGKISDTSKTIIAVGRSTAGIDFESLDGNKTKLFILIIAPENSAGDHIKLLARISKILRNEDVRTDLLGAESAEDIYSIIINEDEKF